jgi:hypothetical protein
MARHKDIALDVVSIAEAKSLIAQAKNSKYNEQIIS